MLKKAFLAVAATLIVVEFFYQISKDRTKPAPTQEKVVDEVALDVHAIHLATDIVNARIDRGEIRSYDQLRESVLNEVAFQKMVVRESK